MAQAPPEVLSPDEAEAILHQPNQRALTGLRNRCVLEIMLWAGLRVSEVVNLRPHNIRWSERRVEIRGSKGGKSRNVRLRPETIDYLQRWKDARPDGDWFFCTCYERGGIASGKPAGSPLSTQYIQQMVKRYANRGGVERKVSPHTFRHTYATMLLDNDFTIREVQRNLGHSNVSTTMIYTHVNDAVIDAKIDAL